MVVQHGGMGVARRAAEHERRRAEREADEAEIDLPDEDERVAVPAHEVLATIALDSPHYAPKPQRRSRSVKTSASGVRRCAGRRAARSRC